MAGFAPLTDERYAEVNPILQNLYAGHTSPQSAAKDLAAISLQTWDEYGPDVELIFEAIQTSAETKPEQHDILSELLVWISRLPAVKDADGNQVMIWGNRRVWEDLPTLSGSLNEYYWNGLELDGRHQPREAAAQGFINMNKFCARTTLTDVPALEFRLFALWTMRAALERAEETERDPRDVFVPAAAQWIDIAGRDMYRWEDDYTPTDSSGGGRPGLGGPLWDEKHGFCEGRWGLWKKRFGELGATSAGSEPWRALAAKANRQMEQVEREAADEHGQGTAKESAE